MAVVTSTVGVKRRHNQVEGQEDFVCDSPGCSRSFTAKRYLSIHQRSHSKTNAPLASLEGWKQHFKYKHIFGIPDGRVWNTQLGSFQKGTRSDGYTALRIEGKVVKRHRLNFEIATGRAIKPGMEIDHIVASPRPTDGSDPPPQDDKWTNLQELTRAEHRRKTLVDNPGIHKKVSIAQGFPLIALQVSTGRETRFISIGEAARTLGLDHNSIGRRIRRGSTKGLRGYIFRWCPEHLAEQSDQPGEVWKDAIFAGQPIKDVRVSNMGRVQMRDGRRTKGQIRNGRHRINLRVQGQKISFAYVLVANTFLGDRPSPEHTVDHIDGNSLNDVLENLRWATKVEQARNQKRNTAVVKYDLEGNVLQIYETIAQAVQDSGLTLGRLTYAARTGGKKTGFLWTRKNNVL